MDRVNWYLAGKIGASDWRCSLVNGLDRAIHDLQGEDSWIRTGNGLLGLDTDWPVLSNAVLGVPGWDYVGPYFTQPRPTAAGLDGGDSGSRLGEAHGIVDPQGHGCIDLGTVFKRCMNALHRADRVLVYIDAPDCFGTLVEIGYAHALGKRIYITSPLDPPFLSRSERWSDQMWLAWECGRAAVHLAHGNTEWLRSPENALLWILAQDLDLPLPEGYGNDPAVSSVAALLVEMQRLRKQPAPAPVAPTPGSPRLDPQRAFSGLQRQEIYLRCNGHCAGCGRPLDSDWQADHVVPHACGGKTEVINGQALCRPCNQRKSDKILLNHE